MGSEIKRDGRGFYLKGNPPGPGRPILTEEEKLAEKARKKVLKKFEKTWEEKLEKALPDEELLGVHKQLIHKKEIIKRFNHETGEYEDEILSDQPETQAATKGLEMAYKLKKRLVANPNVIVPVQINFKDPDAE